MAAINVASTSEFVKLEINSSGVFATPALAMADAANVMTVPALQDVTVSAAPGTFTWQQLDSLSEKIVTTPSTNSISVNLVLDDTTFFTGEGATSGIFDITNSKTKIYFRLHWSGSTSGDRYIEGEGYLSGLAPTVSPSAPVWVTPLEILVDGSYTTGTVA